MSTQHYTEVAATSDHARTTSLSTLGLQEYFVSRPAELMREEPDSDEDPLADLEMIARQSVYERVKDDLVHNTLAHKLYSSLHGIGMRDGRVDVSDVVTALAKIVGVWVQLLTTGEASMESMIYGTIKIASGDAEEGEEPCQSEIATCIVEALQARGFSDTSLREIYKAVKGAYEVLIEEGGKVVSEDDVSTSIERDHSCRKEVDTAPTRIFVSSKIVKKNGKTIAVADDQASSTSDDKLSKPDGSARSQKGERQLWSRTTNNWIRRTYNDDAHFDKMTGKMKGVKAIVTKFNNTFAGQTIDGTKQKERTQHAILQHIHKLRKVEQAAIAKAVAKGAYEEDYDEEQGASEGEQGDTAGDESEDEDKAAAKEDETWTPNVVPE